MIRFLVRRRSKSPASWGGGGVGPIENNLDGGFAATVLYPRTVDNGFANTTSFSMIYDGGGA